MRISTKKLRGYRAKSKEKVGNSINKRERVFSFASLFFGVILDFWREARITKRRGAKLARAQMSERHRRRAIKIRETALKMGGVLIKLGQFLSTRADLMPEEYLQELAKLQDEVPPVSFEEIKKIIEEDFGEPIEEIFTYIDPIPTAAASLAQVHTAILPSGEKVALKILRPGIEQLINIDLAIFGYFMEGLDRFTKVGRQTDIPGLIQEFARTTGDELDFIREGENAERFRKNFEDSSIIYIPKIYWEYTRDRVLALEAVDAIKISDFDAIDRAGIGRTEVAYEIVQSYLKQVLEDGFFHADPHPGNLFVLPGPEITFIDFGMVGEITEEMKERLRDAAIAIAKRDVNGLISVLIALGFIRKGANLNTIRNAINWLFDVYAGFTSHQITFEDLDQIQEDIRHIVYEQPFIVPAHFGYLGRAVGTLLGLTTSLDPNFDFIAAGRPYIEKLVGFGTEGWFKVVAKEARAMAKTLVDIPQQISEVLSQAQKGELSVRVSSNDLVLALARQDRRRRLNAYLITAATLIAAAAVLYINVYIWEAFVALGAGTVILLIALWRGR